ncbi:MAG: DUF4332 domain-containing protein [Saprospiraceae bacterium]|nr:DUF4332 domain-containing protein [Saprospiraceae bacterium]MDW8483227.1 DUF4332 domain-containing protein [Saprospiraceae bacterium]
MLFSYLLLNSFTENLPVALALCIVPFILGWIAAYLYYKVSQLKNDNAELKAKVEEQSNTITELRMHIAKVEADLETRTKELQKTKDALILAESERNALREQLGPEALKNLRISTAQPEVRTVTFAGKEYHWDDLQIIEGIGPKIAELLRDAGITSWQQLSMTSPYRLREILEAAGPQYNTHDPETWPQQAALAADGKWDELQKLQDELVGGRRT